MLQNELQAPTSRFELVWVVFGSFLAELCRSVSPGVTAVRHKTPVSWVTAVSVLTGRYRCLFPEIIE